MLLREASHHRAHSRSQISSLLPRRNRFIELRVVPDLMTLTVGLMLATQRYHSARW